jgi:hypothetical protein
MKKYDFCIVIDSDEYVSEADWYYFRMNLYHIMEVAPPFYIYDIMFDGPPAQSGPRPRLFYKPSLISYYKKHYWWALPNGKIANGSSDSKCIIKGLKIMHDKSHQSEERKQAIAAHHQWLLQEESQQILTNKERMP